MNSKGTLKKIWYFVLMIGLVYVTFSWYSDYIEKKHLAEGWVHPKGWDCPTDHPIKANVESMIYHQPWDQYWHRTNAMNGKCFDTSKHAIQQGFRPIFNGN